MKPASPSSLPRDYAAFLGEIKNRIHCAQVRAHLAVSRELILLYWQIGRDIVSRQKHEGWGKSVIERLASDVQKEFPGIEGFSARNIWRMRGLYLAYSEGLKFLPQAAAEIADGDESPPQTAILPQAATELDPRLVPPNAEPNLAQAAQDLPPAEVLSIPWFHNVILIEKVKDRATRLWYARQTALHGWSRNILALQIENGLHKRQGKAVTNFSRTLPPPQSDLVQQITKDPYNFDFLTLGTDARERELEGGLVAHVEKFLLELGAGFALVGRQVHLEVGDQDFYLDLLFYHWKLRCFIVNDLKAREFTPEAAGKMNFYLSAVDDRYRQPGDQPSIGLILCREKNRIVAEYALRDVQKPIGVSGYVTRLVETLPKTFKGAIPTIAEIESGLSGAPVPPRKKAAKRRKD